MRFNEGGGFVGETGEKKGRRGEGLKGIDGVGMVLGKGLFEWKGKWTGLEYVLLRA